jgi:hypothetical protein
MSLVEASWGREFLAEIDGLFQELGEKILQRLEWYRDS